MFLIARGLEGWQAESVEPGMHEENAAALDAKPPGLQKKFAGHR